MARRGTTETGAATHEIASQRLHGIFADLPAGVVVLRGPEHVVEFANDLYRRLVGRDALLGLPIRRALPEIEGQGFFELLDRVYATGEPYFGHEARVLLERDGAGLEEAFCNFVYLPTRGEDGAIDGVFAHVVDVTELVRARRRAEALAGELEGERARLETLVEQLPAGVVIGEVPSGRLVLANRAWREFFGVAPEDVDDLDAYRLFPGRHEDGRRYEPGEYPLARTIATGETVPAEEVGFVRADGSRRTLEITSAPLRGADGTVTAAVATFFDTTERRRAEGLIEGQKRVLEAVATGAGLHTALGMLVRTIEQHAEHELLGSILLLDGDGRHLRHGAGPSLPDAYNEAIDGVELGAAVGSCGTAAYRRERVVVTDIAQDPLWADFRDLALAHGLRACWSTPIRSHGGDVLGTFAIYYREPRAPRPDEEAMVELVTRTAAVAIERRRLEDERADLLERERVAREQAEARAQAAVSLAYIADGVCLVDGAGVVRLWNPAAERILDRPVDGAVGRPLVEVVPGWGSVAARLADRPAATAETVPLEHDGLELWLSVSAVAFPGGTVYAFRDVTDERRLEEVRADIVATVSHELRTPLAAVYGAAKTLERLGTGAPEQPVLVEIIGGEAERLRALVDEILLASQIEAGAATLRFERRRFDAAALVREVAAAAAPPEGVAVEVEAPAPVFVAADEARARQVLANLVDNALKYGASGGSVTLRAERAGGAARISVGDRGPGIPRHEHERIFEKFHRLDPDLLHGVGGTGLGLYIVRELTSRMGGRISVDSREGAGATFVVELPAAD